MNIIEHGKIEIFFIKSKKVFVEEFTQAIFSDVMSSIFWIDMYMPNQEQLDFFKDVYNIDFSVLKEREAIEHSSRYWEDDDGSIEINTKFFTAFFFAKERQESYYETVSFVLKSGVLFTIRYRKLKTFEDSRRRVLAKSDDWGPFGVLSVIFEVRTDSDADNMEYIAKEISKLRHDILSLKNVTGSEYLEKISLYQQFILQERETILDRKKALISLLKYQDKPIQMREDIEIMLKDIASIIDFGTTNLNTLDNIQNLLMAKINLEQNDVIKMFTIVNVIFLPPTLIASIYGMNFEIMPELKWGYGYLLSVCLMIISSILPIYIFKRKGWIK